MEGVSGGLKKYWRKRVRGYQRLRGSDRRKREAVKQRRRGWRIKIAPKIRVPKISSPKKLVLWVRDAYMKMMLTFANSMAASATGYATAPPPKEYDQRMIIHMYNSFIMAQG